MTKPIPDKAEITLEFPDKLYLGSFGRSSRFDAHLDSTGVSLLFDCPGDAETRKSVHIHIRFELFADILRALAETVPGLPAESLSWPSPPTRPSTAQWTSGSAETGTP